MAPRELANYRLINQQIAATKGKTPREVVRSLGAMQAQDYLGALWAIGLRTPDATQSSVEQAIAERAIVRTWPMRGTLHFVAAEDVRWMLELLTPRIIAGSAGRHRQLELDEATFSRSRKLFTKALQGGKHLTRDEMHALLERSHISPAGQRGYHILWRLAQEGLLCFGERTGKQPTFVLLDEWLPNARRLARDEAFAELARRYFAGHGPATLQDFVWWSGLKVSDARAALDMVAAELARERVEGADYWLPQNMPALAMAPAAVSLLPGFDEYLLGYTDRSASVNPQHAQQLTPTSNGMFLPTIVKNGQVVGTWKRVLKKNVVTVAVRAFASWSKADSNAVAGAAERYGRFLNLPVKVSVP